MTPTNHLLALGFALLLAAPAFNAHAGDGHDHGEAPATAAGPAWPRFTASSENFELVGVVNGQRLTLYLDRAADNSPVRGATLELEIAGMPVKVQPHGEGEFEALLAAPPAAGVSAVTATVLAGSETDLLAGELDIHAPEHSDEAAPGGRWKTPAAWAASAVAVTVLVAALGFGLRRARQQRDGAAA